MYCYLPRFHPYVEVLWRAININFQTLPMCPTSHAMFSLSWDGRNIILLSPCPSALWRTLCGVRIFKIRRKICSSFLKAWRCCKVTQQVNKHTQADCEQLISNKKPWAHLCFIQRSRPTWVDTFIYFGEIVDSGKPDCSSGTKYSKGWCFGRLEIVRVHSLHSKIWWLSLFSFSPHTNVLFQS